MNRTAHSILVPWPISEGIRTWCGISATDVRVAEGDISNATERVTCAGCRNAMRQALDSLGRWVPWLEAEQ